MDYWLRQDYSRACAVCTCPLSHHLQLQLHAEMMILFELQGWRQQYNTTNGYWMLKSGEIGEIGERWPETTPVVMIAVIATLHLLLQPTTEQIIGQPLTSHHTLTLLSWTEGLPRKAGSGDDRIVNWCWSLQCPLSPLSAEIVTLWLLVIISSIESGSAPDT